MRLASMRECHMTKREICPRQSVWRVIVGLFLQSGCALLPSQTHNDARRIKTSPQQSVSRTSALNSDTPIPFYRMVFAPPRKGWRASSLSSVHVRGAPDLNFVRFCVQ